MLAALVRVTGLDLDANSRASAKSAPRPRCAKVCKPARSEAGTVSTGTWPSLVGHLTGGQGVAGSNPAVPTSTTSRLIRDPPQVSGPFMATSCLPRKLDRSQPGTIWEPPGSQVGAEGISRTGDQARVRMQVALCCHQRAVPGDLPEYVHRNASVGHPCQPRMAQAMTPEVLVAEMAHDFVPVSGIPQYSRGERPPHAPVNGKSVRGQSIPHKEPAPESACAHQARPVTERRPPVRINVDAKALIAREQAVTGAVSQAMLAVTSLRHPASRQERGRLPAHAFLAEYSAQGERPTR